MENHWVKITWILNYINMQESHFMRENCFFNIIYMTGEWPEEWKNSIVILICTKCCKQMVKICSLMDVFYSTVVNKKLKAKAKQLLWFAQNRIWKSRYCIDASFAMKTLTETRRYHIETYLMCLDCLKAFDRVKWDK